MTWRGEAIAARGGNQSQGYYAGYGPLSGGSGSGMGQAVMGAGQLAPGNGVQIGGQTWHPTLIYLFALVFAEMFVFGFIGRFLR